MAETRRGFTFWRFKPFEHHCSKDRSEMYRGGKYDMAWTAIFFRLPANDLLWICLLYHTSGDEKYSVGPLLPKPNLVPGADFYFRRTQDGYTSMARYPLSSL